MARITRIEPEDWRDELRPHAESRIRHGFAANSVRTYAHQPKMAAALLDFTLAVFQGGTVDPQLKALVRTLTSQANGCRYCASHQLATVQKLDVPAAKLADLWDFETSTAFTEAERAALRFTLRFTTAHESLTDADFEEMKAHWSEPEVLEIMLTSAVMGLLNHMHDSLALPVDERFQELGKIALERKLSELPV